MTDKERIIIDGVDVSECPALCCGKTCFLSQHYPFTNPKYKIFCEENQNCDHKQLARKTQKLEQYKASKQASYEALQKQCNELELKNRKLKHECEELKEQLQANQPTGICETCTTKTLLQNDKYCKALEEIKKIINDDGCTSIRELLLGHEVGTISDRELYEQLYVKLNAILDIISGFADRRSKGEKNGINYNSK